MASPGSSGDRSPAVPRKVLDDLLGVHKRVAMLQTMVDGSPAAARELVDGMMTRVTNALTTALNTSGVVVDGVEWSSLGSRGWPGGRRDSAGAVVHRRSSSSRRRTLSPFLKTVTTTTLDDGHAWRKYGQKRIHDSENPRSYYRCTHMPDQGCKARKQVQVSDSNPSEYVVSYFGQHTCRDPSTVPIVIDAPMNLSNFISFGGSTAATSAAHAVPPRHLQAVAPTTMRSRLAGYISSSLPAAAEQRCRSEEAISLAGELGAVVAGALSNAGRTTVGSAPEFDVLLDVGVDTAGSFPSSPSSLGGFMTGSFGSFGDDDFFGFDP